MSFIRASGLGPLTASNTATIVDPATPVNGVAYVSPLVAFPVTTASGTSILYTGIPSWIKRINICFQSVQVSATATIIVQIGSGSLTTSGYLGGAGYYYSGTNAFANYTAGLPSFYNLGSTNVTHGIVTIMALGSNRYVSNFAGAQSDLAVAHAGGGSITLGGILDRINITTVAGTATLSGTINVSYE